MNFQPEKVPKKISLETATFFPQICLFFFLFSVAWTIFLPTILLIENINNYSAFLKFPSV